MDQRALLELENQIARIAVGLYCVTACRQVWPVIGFFSSIVATGMPFRPSTTSSDFS